MCVYPFLALVFFSAAMALRPQERKVQVHFRVHRISDQQLWQFHDDQFGAWALPSQLWRNKKGVAVDVEEEEETVDGTEVDVEYKPAAKGSFPLSKVREPPYVTMVNLADKVGMSVNCYVVVKDHQDTIWPEELPPTEGDTVPYERVKAWNEIKSRMKLDIFELPTISVTVKKSSDGNKVKFDIGLEPYDTVGTLKEKMVEYLKYVEYLNAGKTKDDIVAKKKAFEKPVQVKEMLIEHIPQNLLGTWRTQNLTDADDTKNIWTYVLNGKRLDEAVNVHFGDFNVGTDDRRHAFFEHVSQRGSKTTFELKVSGP